jgi:anthranilate synthase/aminodeoxychorismate synthase-like glutamine amidotransferase
MILIIDNYDSFVHNIARYFVELGAGVHVVRNDEVTGDDLRAKAIVISPGPCTPAEAGQSLAIVREQAGRLPMLGICLGHQVIGEAFGGMVVRARHPMHGDFSTVRHSGEGIFRGLPSDVTVGRYHSLIVEDVEDTPLKITARSEDGEIMGLQHESLPIFGLQFHPESILTEHGYDMLSNFLKDIT